MLEREKRRANLTMERLYIGTKLFFVALRRVSAIFPSRDLRASGRFFERGSLLLRGSRACRITSYGRPVDRPPRKVVPFSGRSPIIPFFFRSSPFFFFLPIPATANTRHCCCIHAPTRPRTCEAASWRKNERPLSRYPRKLDGSHPDRWLKKKKKGT